MVLTSNREKEKREKSDWRTHRVRDKLTQKGRKEGRKWKRKVMKIFTSRYCTEQSTVQYSTEVCWEFRVNCVLLLLLLLLFSLIRARFRWRFIIRSASVREGEEKFFLFADLPSAWSFSCPLSLFPLFFLFPCRVVSLHLFLSFLFSFPVSGWERSQQNRTMSSGFFSLSTHPFRPSVSLSLSLSLITRFVQFSLFLVWHVNAQMWCRLACPFSKNITIDQATNGHGRVHVSLCIYVCVPMQVERCKWTIESHASPSGYVTTTFAVSQEKRKNKEKGKEKRERKRENKHLYCCTSRLLLPFCVHGWWVMGDTH